MGRWVRAGTLADLRPGHATAVSIEGRWIALYRDHEGRVQATDDACPHEGTSLAEGVFHEGRVICTAHDWIFDVASGRCLNMPGERLTCYATRSVGPDVEIELHEDE